jgi:hypothetical protein
MPYIPEIDRPMLSAGKFDPKTPGELNFMFTRISDLYLKGDLSYSKINEVIGALECCKLELYRRIAAPYEDVKIIENGDVYKTKVPKKPRVPK